MKIPTARQKQKGVSSLLFPVVDERVTCGVGEMAMFGAQKMNREPANAVVDDDSISLSAAIAFPAFLTCHSCGLSLRVDHKKLRGSFAPESGVLRRLCSSAGNLKSTVCHRCCTSGPGAPKTLCRFRHTWGIAHPEAERVDLSGSLFVPP